jgi:hypothetical protein
LAANGEIMVFNGGFDDRRSLAMMKIPASILARNNTDTSGKFS